MQHRYFESTFSKFIYREQYFRAIYKCGQLVLKSGRARFRKLISPSVSFICSRSTIIVPSTQCCLKDYRVFACKLLHTKYNFQQYIYTNIGLYKTLDFGSLTGCYLYTLFTDGLSLWHLKKSAFIKPQPASTLINKIKDN